MEQYINKAAVVAEIESLLDKGKYHEEYDCAYRDGNNGALYALKGKVNSLEVKEVDLEKEFDNYAKDILACDVQIQPFTHLYNCAKYFYELGIKSQTKDMIEALRTEYEKGRHDVIEKTLKWLWDLNQEHEIMSYTDSHVLGSEELQKYYKNNIEE